jgi:hypothetical protein
MLYGCRLPPVCIAAQKRRCSFSSHPGIFFTWLLKAQQTSALAAAAAVAAAVCCVFAGVFCSALVLALLALLLLLL